MTELRSLLTIDQIQPQTLCALGTWMRGSLPRTGMSAAVIEVAPGLDIEEYTDVALKSAEVQAGVLVVERQFGYLEFHSRSNEAVHSARDAVLAAMGTTAAAANPPEILASRVISSIDAMHAFLLNRNSTGSLVLGGDSMYVIEMRPAAYAVLAVNQAEKEADIRVVDFRMMGATGRAYLAGAESAVRTAADAATAALTGAAR